MKQNIQKKGANPKLLILSGTHGDEYQVIASVQKAINKYHTRLSDFLYIPEVSPSAVAQRTRHNKDNVDVNRSFFETTNIVEVQEMMHVLKQYTFDICWEFHEDPVLDTFYLYDSGQMTNDSRWIGFSHALKAREIGLFHGIDDPNDSSLGYEIKNGYVSVPSDLNEKEIIVGTFSEWAIKKGVVKRVLNPEVPGKTPQKIKDEIVELLFTHFII